MEGSPLEENRWTRHINYLFATPTIYQPEKMVMWIVPPEEEMTYKTKNQLIVKNVIIKRTKNSLLIVHSNWVGNDYITLDDLMGGDKQLVESYFPYTMLKNTLKPGYYKGSLIFRFWKDDYTGEGDSSIELGTVYPIKPSKVKKIKKGK